MENTNRFFSNKECKYFPCQTMPDNSEFNCLFCFCPLYTLYDKCGGNFKFGGEKNFKTCIDCHLPHTPEYYDIIMNILKETIFNNGKP